MEARVAECKKMIEKEPSNQLATVTNNPVVNLTEFLDGQEGDADSGGNGAFEFEVKGNACKVKLITMIC